MNNTAVRVKTTPVSKIWTGRERAKSGLYARYGSSSYLNKRSEI